MNLECINIEELVYIRQLARDKKDWKLSDEIRDYLETKHVFIFDTKDGQNVHYKLSGTREDLINQLNSDARANKMFDSWLFSMNKKQI